MSNSVTHSSNDIVFFSCYSAFRFLNRFDNRFFIQRFYCMNIDDFYADTFFLQGNPRLNCIPYEVATGKNAHISSLGKILSLPDLKIRLLCKDGPDRAAKTQIDRSYVFCDSNRCCFCLAIVAGNDHSHTR